MRKVYNYTLTLVMAVFTVFSLASCTDDDVDQAYDMNGIWQGTIQGEYYNDRY